uniref:Uncharacterized protein n=1 Tax=Anguilla anguilla TaxID=7936 RepID=A0A0E9WJH7_ANGAN
MLKFRFHYIAVSYPTNPSNVSLHNGSLCTSRNVPLSPFGV